MTTSMTYYENVEKFMGHDAYLESSLQRKHIWNSSAGILGTMSYPPPKKKKKLVFALFGRVASRSLDGGAHTGYATDNSVTVMHGTDDGMTERLTY